VVDWSFNVKITSQHLFLYVI